MSRFLIATLTLILADVAQAQTPTPTLAITDCCQCAIFGSPLCVAPPPTTTPGVFTCGDPANCSIVRGAVCGGAQQCLTPTLTPATPSATPTRTVTPTVTLTPTRTLTQTPTITQTRTPTANANDCCQCTIFGFPVCVAPPPTTTPGVFTCGDPANCSLVLGSVCDIDHQCASPTRTPTVTLTPTGFTPTRTPTTGPIQEGAGPTSTPISTAPTNTRTFTATPTPTPTISGMSCCQCSLFGQPLCVAPPPTTTPGVYVCGGGANCQVVGNAVCDPVTYMCVSPTPIETPLRCRIFTMTATPSPTATFADCSGKSFTTIRNLGPASMWRFSEQPPSTYTAGTSTPGTPTRTPTMIPAADSVDSNPGHYSFGVDFTGAGIDLNGANSVTTTVTYPAEQQQTVLMCFNGTTGTLASFAASINQSPTALLEVSNAGTVYWGITYGDGQQQLVPEQISGFDNPVVSDGIPHVVVASLGPDGQKTYVDGQLIGTRPYRVFKSPQSTWTWGWGSVTNWPAVSTFGYTGHIDGAAWWPTTQLTDAQVASISAFTPTITPTVTITPTPSQTRTITITRTITPTRTFTPGPSQTPTATVTGTPPTATPTPTPTNSPTRTPTDLPTFAPTFTPIPDLACPQGNVHIFVVFPHSCVNAMAQVGQLVVWGNPQNAVVGDNNPASIILFNQSQSVGLYCDYDVSSFPFNAQLIDVQLAVQGLTANNPWFESTNSVAGIRLVRMDGSIVGPPGPGPWELSQGSRLPQSFDPVEPQRVYYGGLWGTTWNLGTAPVGALFGVEGAINLATQGNVDSFLMTLSYCLP